MWGSRGSPSLGGWPAAKSQAPGSLCLSRPTIGKPTLPRGRCQGAGPGSSQSHQSQTWEEPPVPSVMPGLGQKEKNQTNDFHIRTIFVRGESAPNYACVFGLGSLVGYRCHDAHCTGKETEAALPCRLGLFPTLGFWNFTPGQGRRCWPGWPPPLPLSSGGLS